MELTDKIAVINGAGSGNGWSLAQRFAANGALTVICTDLNEADATAIAESIGSQAYGEQLDVSDETAIEQLVARVKETHGGIDT